MSDLNRDTVNGYMIIFEDYQPMHPDLQAQVDELGLRMYELAAAQPDPLAFYQALTESGLQEEYSALMGKVVMANMGTAAPDGSFKTDYSDTPAPEPLSVRQYLDQYRIPYEEVKKAGYRKQAEKAYENLFSVADETENMQDAQLLIEENNLLWKLVQEDSLDIFQAVLAAMDPLQPESLSLQKHVKIYQESDSDEVLTYALEIMEAEKPAQLGWALAQIQLTVLLAGLLMDYWAAKLAAQKSGGQGAAGQKALKSMIALRLAAQKCLAFCLSDFGMTFTDLIQKPGLMIWLLIPQNADELGRFKVTLHPQNIAALEDLVQEIQSDLSILDLLQRENRAVIWYGLTGQEGRAYQEQANKQAQTHNASLTYYRYKDSLAQAAAAHLPEKEVKSRPMPSLFQTEVRPAAKEIFKGLFGRRRRNS